MTRHRPVATADDLPKLRADAEKAVDRYSETAQKAGKLFFERLGENLSPDLLRLVAVRFLEMADEREPAPVSGNQVARAYGWERRTFTVRDAATLPTVHLISHLAGIGYTSHQIGDELAARRFATVSGRAVWQARVIEAVAERERGRAPIWTGSPLLDTQ